jgi:hypothetical protein
MDLNHGSTGYEPVGISGRPGFPAVFLTTLPRCGAAMGASVYELRPQWRRLPYRSDLPKRPTAPSARRNVQ